MSFFDTTTGKVLEVGAGLGLLGLGINAVEQNAEAKRVKQTEEEYQKKYPFSNSCIQQKNILKNANLELGQLNATKGGDAGAVRIRNRRTNALKKRITEINTYIPGLDCTAELNAQLAQSKSTSSISSNALNYVLIGGGVLIAVLVISHIVKK